MNVRKYFSYDVINFKNTKENRKSYSVYKLVYKKILASMANR